MRKTTLAILFIAAVVAAWAQKADKKTMKLEKQLVGTFCGDSGGTLHDSQQ